MTSSLMGKDEGAARAALRAKQDRLLELADRRNYSYHLRISSEHAGAPTLGQLIPCIWPEWEEAIDRAIQILEECGGPIGPPRQS